MTPWQWWRLYRRIDRVGESMQEATVKKLWHSRTFWFNLLSSLVEVVQLVAQYHLLPPGVTTILVNLINIWLRMVTDEPVTARRS